MIAKPCVVISLDFEMRWGMHDKLGLNMDAYRKNLENEPYIVLALLKLFKDRNLKVTWACVGALGCRNWDEYFARAPSPPEYENTALRVNPKYAEMDPGGQLHFAPELLTAIHNSPGQELGSHTFSHIYMREPGIAGKDAVADMDAVISLWKERFGAAPLSLVFPRNQIAFLEEIRSSSIRIWRGNEKCWYLNKYELATNKALPRALRLLEAINPFVRRACALDGDSTRSSLFLRVNIPSVAWLMHRERIKNELRALRDGKIFHLWWHPHNLGSNVHLGLSRVEEILELVAEKVSQGLVSSKCMSDLIQDAPSIDCLNRRQF